MTPLLIEFIDYCAKLEADPLVVATLLAKNDDVHADYLAMLMDMDEGHVQAMGGFVYDLPMLSKVECDYIINCASHYDFTPNLEEGAEYRIEEAIIDRVDPELYAHLIDTLLPKLNAYCLVINSTPITKVDSLQIAKYRPDGTAGTGWHHDKTSDFTCVISLNPGEFEGGGTGVRLAPHATWNIAPLAKGNGLIFNGRSVQHRGLPVTKGERLLLVCWCSTRELDK